MEQQVQLYFFGVLMTSVWALYVTKGQPLAIQGNLNMTIMWLLILTILLGGACGPPYFPDSLVTQGGAERYDSLHRGRGSKITKIGVR